MNRQELRDKVFMKIALEASNLSTCFSKKVGAVIVNDDNRLISIGYNGSEPGKIHCEDAFNALFVDSHSEEGSILKMTQEEKDEWHSLFHEKIPEIHAETNAILNAHKLGYDHLDNCTIYTTLSPCDDCLNRIIQENISRIVYLNKYEKSHNIFDQEYIQKLIVMHFE